LWTSPSRPPSARIPFPPPWVTLSSVERSLLLCFLLEDLWWFDQTPSPNPLSGTKRARRSNVLSSEPESPARTAAHPEDCPISDDDFANKPPKRRRPSLSSLIRLTMEEDTVDEEPPAIVSPEIVSALSNSLSPARPRAHASTSSPSIPPPLRGLSRQGRAAAALLSLPDSPARHQQ